MSGHYVYDDGGGWGDCRWLMVLLGVLTTLLVLMLSGCKSGEVAVVQQHTKTDTCYITKEQRDSIWLHDSIYVHEWTRQDTVYLLQERWHTKYKEKFVRDTVYTAKVDSVLVPYEVVKEMPRSKRWWEKALTWWGLVCFVLVGAWVYLKLK